MVTRLAAPPDVFCAVCPTRQALDRLSDKWTALLVGALENGPHRFGELRRRLEGVSHKMLTQTLRSLERDGLIRRRVHATRPVRVEYSLTELGGTLAEPLAAVRAWAETHIEQVLEAQDRFDTAEPETASDGGAPIRR